MEDKPTNYFVRVLILILVFALAALVYFKVFETEPKGQIDAAVLTIIAFTTVLVLSEAFDNFAIGKLISLSRENKKNVKQVEKLEGQNSQLLTQLISVSTSQSQVQSHINVSGDYHEGLRVEKATDEDVSENQLDETSTPEPTPSRPMLNYQAVEEIALNHYIAKQQIQETDIIRNTRLVSAFKDVDRISNSPILFDGYFKEPNREVFVEVRPVISIMMRDKLYMMLSKIRHYGQQNGVAVHLDLVAVMIPSRSERYQRTWKRIQEEFEPAISSGLLRVTLFELTEEQEAEATRERGN